MSSTLAALYPLEFDSGLMAILALGVVGLLAYVAFMVWSDIRNGRLG